MKHILSYVESRFEECHMDCPSFEDKSQLFQILKVRIGGRVKWSGYKIKGKHQKKARKHSIYMHCMFIQDRQY